LSKIGHLRKKVFFSSCDIYLLTLEKNSEVIKDWFVVKSAINE